MPNGDAVSLAYDKLGRLIERQVNGTPDGSWHYDNAAADKGLGLLDYEDNHGAGGHGLRKTYVDLLATRTLMFLWSLRASDVEY